MPGNPVNFRPTDPAMKKTAVLAVISFNDALGVPYSRGQVYKYFDVLDRTAQYWCSAASSGSRSAQQAESTSKQPESRGIKRARSKDKMEEPSSSVSSSFRQLGASGHQKPAQNRAQGRKKLKPTLKQSASPPPPHQLLTPPRQKISQPRKRIFSNTEHQAETTESSFGLGRESSDEDFEV